MVKRPPITPAVPIILYMAFQPYILIKMTHKDEIPPPTYDPAVSMALAVDLYYGGK